MGKTNNEKENTFTYSRPQWEIFVLSSNNQSAEKICKTALQKFGKTQLRTPIPEKRVGSGVSWH